MGLRDRIEKFKNNNEKRRIIKELSKNKNFVYNIRLIIDKYLDDDELFKIFLDNLDNIDEYWIEYFIGKASIDIILSNDVLLDRVCIYYSEKIKEFINDNFDINLIDKFNMLIENDKFKSKINEKLDINSLGRDYYKRYLDKYSLITNFDEVNDLLGKLGFKIDDEYIYNTLINSDYRVQNKLMQVVTINENIVDRLYQYKYELLKNWIKNKEGGMPNFYISKELVPSSDNEFANYWRNQSILLGEDALEFVFDRIKDCYKINGVNGIIENDLFSEKSKEEVIEDLISYFGYRNWNLSEEDFARQVQYLYDEFDKITLRIFDKKGLPLQRLFSRKIDLNLSSKVLDYNREGMAIIRSYYGISYSEPDYKVIKFLINNIDRIPEEYQFIFEKLKELEKIEDEEIRKNAQMEFLLIMTDGHRIVDEKYRLYDTNGFNDNFYDALFDSDSMEYIDFYARDWKEHYSNNELMWFQNFKKIFSYNCLSDLYNSENHEHLGMRKLINYYFSDGKPNNSLALDMLFNFNYRKELSEYDFSEVLCLVEKSYYNFLKQINFSYDIKFSRNEINVYFDDLGPKPELCIYLYNKNDFDKIILTNLEYKNILNEKDSLILDNYKKIDDVSLKGIYKNYIIDNKEDISVEKINLVADVLKKISESNSMELITLRTQIANQLLQTDDPIGNFNLIEEKFVQNNLPTVGKIFSVFEILHPDFSGFNFSESSMVSPVLKKKSNKVKEFIVFADLIRITLGSNNRSLKEYMNYIKEGDKLYQILKNNSNYEINEDEKNILVNYIKYIITLYNNTKRGKINPYILNNKNYIETLDELKQLLSMDGNLDYSLSDRVVSMFCHVAGFNTLEELDTYMHDKIAGADRKNRLKTSINLQPGDLIKGIGDIKYLGHILQNGSVAKEYLGQYATSDLTPLDTDLSMILKSGRTPMECMEGTAANGYGPIWFVVRNDNRLSFTRRSDADPNQEIDDTTDLTKSEAFYTGAVGRGHYGIRTGFASSDIDYIIVESYDKRIGLEIAMNGFYIPVFDKSGNRVFSPEDYDKLREKMQGLSYYGTDKYEVSKNLNIPGIEEMVKKIPDSISDVIRKRRAINSTIKKVLEKFNLDLKDHFDGDLSEGFIELIDTGSTGRFTNMPGDGDFDFMLKLDRKIKDDPEKMNKLKLALLKEFHCDENDMIDSGDFRLKKVKLDNLDVPVDIDITFEVKTDKIAYSTDECLKDRLKNIRKTNPEEYYLIISNILLAKKYLKEFEVYKPDRGDNPQGGLGGVGIENWILQYGGSFYDAAKSFLEAARGKSFEEFQKSYVIWDFGENHLVTRKNIYPHDNFVYNMSESGYNKMKDALEKLLKNINKYGLENIEGYKIK